jgi:uncharacterized protein YpmB
MKDKELQKVDSRRMTLQYIFIMLIFFLGLLIVTSVIYAVNSSPLDKETGNFIKSLATIGASFSTIWGVLKAGYII